VKQVLIKGGSVVVEEIPEPIVSENSILVAVSYSCVSIGTEIAGVKMSGLPLYRRALKQPENVKRVLEMMRDQGVKRTMDRVRGKLSAGSPTGYSAAGIVIATGNNVQGFSIGDRVACAGAGIANHAEVINVPVNLAVKIPTNISDHDASTVTLGAIALQGVRRTNPTLGETVAVIGLGILGQITVQLLKSNGCKVIGSDIDNEKVELGLKHRMDYGINPSSDDFVERVLKYTDGLGADAVLITAASDSDEIVSQAMQATRKKGRVVLVGDVGLNLKRGDFYSKELDFFISTSYGPGRYDPVYEEGGNDYPLAYVRWTENRNMEAYLDMIASCSIKLSVIPHEKYGINEATTAYDRLKGEGNKPLLVYLKYPRADERETIRTVNIGKNTQVSSDIIRVGLVGASSFVQGVHLPNMVKLRDKYKLQAVMNRTGSTAVAVAKQYEADYATTDFEEILNDPNIDLVMITTRHNLHGSMVLKTLQAGKNVFVEKPLAVNQEELNAIKAFYTRNDIAPILMTGFNRRFSPVIQRTRAIIQDRSTPIIVNYRMNAGYIPLEHWVQTEEGAGRNIGEACHIYDIFNYLTGAEVVSVSASAITPQSKQWAKNDNFVATVTYSDGSVCSLTYTAMGNKSFSKEKMDVYSDGMVISMNDYKSLEVIGSKNKNWNSKIIQKGQPEELKALANCLQKGGEMPITLQDQFSATSISFDVEHQITHGPEIK
jgi:predicted dehydrogenase/threonine dehydrogenase-like Zn-dependent dehydrogenase